MYLYLKIFLDIFFLKNIYRDYYSFSDKRDGNYIESRNMFVEQKKEIQQRLSGIIDRGFLVVKIFCVYIIVFLIVVYR